MTLRNLQIDPVTGDLAVVNNNFVVVSDLDSIVQAVRCLLRLFKSEWYLDANRGTPWFQEILQKGQSPQFLQSTFTDLIESVPGVTKVTAISLDVDRDARRLNVVFTAATDLGEINQTVGL